MSRKHKIIEFEEKYRSDVIDLWKACGLCRPWNDPDWDIDRVLADVNGKLFLLVHDGRLLGSVMTGYDGHRGWVYYLAVEPDIQRKGYGRKLMGHSEEYLRSIGCPKLNLMVRNDNSLALEFYGRLGYGQDEVLVMSKKLVSD